MAHTPGPWEVNSELVVLDKNNNEVCVPAISAQLLECKDNARLIAAAPDMLTALKMAQDYLGGWPSDPHQRNAREAVRAAIAKAEGR